MGAETILPLLVDGATKGLVILLIAALLVRTSPRASAAARHMVWLLAIIGLLVIPAMSALLPAWKVLPVWVSAAGPLPPLEWPTADRPVSHAEPNRAVPSVRIEPHPLSLPSVERIEPVEPLSPETAQVHWSTWLTTAWLAGVVACLLPPLIGTASLWRLGRNSRPITDPAWTAMLTGLAAELSVSRHVELLVSPDRAMPMTWGTFRPRLLLPAEATDWSADRRQVVLLHELAHIRRHDCLAQWLTHFARALHWFNPLMWHAASRMSAEREQACDDLVVTAGCEPADYAHELLTIASGLRTPALAAHSSIAMARPSKLEGRLLAILDATRNRRRLSALTGVVATLLFVGLIVPISIAGLAAPPAPDGLFMERLRQLGIQPGTSTTFSDAQWIELDRVSFIPRSRTDAGYELASEVSADQTFTTLSLRTESSRLLRLSAREPARAISEARNKRASLAASTARSIDLKAGDHVAILTDATVPGKRPDDADSVPPKVVVIQITNIRAGRCDVEFWHDAADVPIVAAVAASGTGVSPNGDLQSLIGKSKAGDVISVHAGKYTAPLGIKRAVTLRGEDRDKCILEVESVESAVRMVNAGKVTLDNLTIKWAMPAGTPPKDAAAVIVSENTELTIKNCRVVPIRDPQRMPAGLLATGANSRVHILDSVFEGFEFTVNFQHGLHEIKNSIFRRAGHCAITVHGPGGAQVWDSVIVGSNYHGLRSSGGELNITRCLIAENRVSGVYLGNKKAYSSVNENLFYRNGSGVWGLYQTNLNGIKWNLFLENKEYGVVVWDSCRVGVIGYNSFVENGTAILRQPNGKNLPADELKLLPNHYWKNTKDVDGFEPGDSIAGIPLFLRGDPLFTDKANGDFTPRPGSPMLDERGKPPHGLPDPAAMEELWKKWKAGTVGLQQAP